MTVSDDDEEVTAAAQADSRGRPNAYFAGYYTGLEAAGYDAHFRGVPSVPHGGQTTVRPEDTLGSVDLCWCGEHAGHSWPGKDRRVPHPRGTEMNQPLLIQRRDLRAYHRSLQDFILLAQTDGLKLRLNKNSCVVYPTDGTKAITVHARNTDSQLRAIHKWYAQHVFAPAVGEVAAEIEAAKPEQIAKLAAVVNDPIEHPTPAAPLPSQVAPKVPAATWRPYVTSKGKTLDHIQTDGSLIQCVSCHEMLNGVNSIAGHLRVKHSDTSTLYGPDARAKATDTRRADKLRDAVVSTIELLSEEIGYQPEVKHDEAKVIHLEAMLKAANKRADEAEAKLKKLREALA